jgi:hypothetical protein
MALLVIVIMMMSDSFQTIITQSKRLMFSEESNIEGVVGLEIMRHDLQSGGFGLPYEFPAAPPIYQEAANAPANSYNDAPSNVPRAFVSGNNLSGVSETGSGATYNVVNGSDYLAVKGTSLGRSNTAQRWTYLPYSSLRPKTWPSSAENIKNSAWVIVLKKTFTNNQASSRLVVDSSQDVASNLYFSPNYSPTGFVATNFNPQSATDMYFIYGIDDDDIRMPFNRADYFVATPATAGSMSTTCAPNTGVLYKTSVKQANGRLNYIPLVDCVADMQIVYGWDLRNAGSTGTDGLVDTYTNADGTAAIGAGTVGALPADFPAAVNNAATIRSSLKLIKIYLLVQNGRKDPSYTSPPTFNLFDSGESTLGRTYTLTAPMRNYRWKVYKLVVKPKNLISNQ